MVLETKILQENLTNYNNITKQTPEFVHQIILVSILHKFLNSGIKQEKELFLTFLKDNKSEWLSKIGTVDKNENDLAFNEFIGDEKDITKKFTVAARFGLVRHQDKSKSLDDDLEFKNIEITEIFYEINKQCNSHYYNTYLYNDILNQQLSLLTNTKGTFRRLYVLELECLLNDIKYITRNEIRIFHFFFDHSQEKIIDKIKLTSECIFYLRQQCKINNTEFDIEFDNLFSSEIQLKEDIYKKEKEDRLWQILQDNFDIKYNLNLIYHNLLKRIYLNKQNIFNDSIELQNLYKLNQYDFQNYLCKLKPPIKEVEMNITKELSFDLIEPTKFNELNDIDKLNLSKNISELFTYGNESIYSVLLFSNPNSGKTQHLHSLMEKIPKINLSLKNTKNPTEWQEKIFIQNIAGISFVGPILKMIANSSIFPEVPHVIYEDEVGEFELDFVLGPTLKSILKSDQRVNITNLIDNNIVLKDLFEDIKKQKKITLNQYIYIGNILKETLPYQMTIYKYNELEIPLWLPDNLYVIFTSNYELGMAKSLHDQKGWGKKGKRFYAKHLYNSGNYNDNNLVQIKSDKISKVIIDFNENFLKSFGKILELSSLSQEDKEEFKLKKYEFLVPNFYQFNSIVENEQKEELKERLESLFYEFGFQNTESIIELLL